MNITVQFLENSSEALALSPQKASEILYRTFDALPFSHLLLGWQIPASLQEICKTTANNLGIKLIRWHPLLTGNDAIQPSRNLRVVGLQGNLIPGFNNMPEFTFICPNNPEAAGKIIDHVQSISNSGLYDGMFLDRIRWPSPTGNPFEYSGCFCKYCQKAALNTDIDLIGIQSDILQLFQTNNGKLQLVRGFLNFSNDPLNNQLQCLSDWLKFRTNSITTIVGNVSKIARSSGLEVGLDCFSPGLTRMVGQDLEALSPFADWIKVMCYAHTFGPAGLPFEIYGLMKYLTTFVDQTNSDARDFLSTNMSIPIPGSAESCQKNGLDTDALLIEIQKGIRMVSTKLFAGLELVEIPGVSSLNDNQITREHHAVRALGVDGLSISWDLLHIPNDRLIKISDIWS